MSLADPNLARKRSQAITAIASVADCVEEGFAVYYGSIMPTLKQMLVSCNTKVCSCVCVRVCVCGCAFTNAPGSDSGPVPVPLSHSSRCSRLGPDAGASPGCPVSGRTALDRRQPRVSGFRPNRLC